MPNDEYMLHAVSNENETEKWPWNEITPLSNIYVWCWFGAKQSEARRCSFGYKHLHLQLWLLIFFFWLFSWSSIFLFLFLFFFIDLMISWFIYLLLTIFFFFFWIWITLECEDLWTTTLSLFHHQMKDNTYKGLGVNLIFIVYALNSWA